MDQVSLHDMSCVGAPSPAFKALFNAVIDGDQGRVDEISPICKAVRSMPPIALTPAEDVSFTTVGTGRDRGSNAIG
jgi:hypothetical protein